MPDSPENWVWLARIRRPQGRKGELLAELLTDFPEKFAERRLLWLLPPEQLAAPGSSHLGTPETIPALLQPRPAELAHHWLHKGAIVLHFAGIDSISAAEALKGLIVAIPRAERAPLAEGETYVGDLIGCTLVDLSGPAPLTVGVIDQVDRASGPAPLLVLHGPRGEILIPFAKSYLRNIDLAGRRVEMSLPEGLIDLNTKP